jgi:hypothetical protein
LFDRSPGCEVDGAVLEQGTQLDFNLIEVKKCNPSRGMKCGEDIDITAGAEVIPEDRTKQFQLDNLPLLAESREAIAFNRESRANF